MLPEPNVHPRCDWQFDFHTYCLRKMTLRAYVMLLKCEDTIYKHKFFVRAALSLVETYTALYDKPESATAEEADPELEVPPASCLDTVD